MTVQRLKDGEDGGSDDDDIRVDVSPGDASFCPEVSRVTALPERADHCVDSCRRDLQTVDILQTGTSVPSTPPAKRIDCHLRTINIGDGRE